MNTKGLRTCDVCPAADRHSLQPSYVTPLWDASILLQKSVFVIIQIGEKIARRDPHVEDEEEEGNAENGLGNHHADQSSRGFMAWICTWYDPSFSALRRATEGLTFCAQIPFCSIDIVPSEL